LDPFVRLSDLRETRHSAARRGSWPDALATARVLRQRDFGAYFVGNLTSNCGTWFQNLAQAILIYRLTGSAFLLGVVNFAQFFGVIVLAPWAGSAADRYDRRRLLIVTQLVAAVATGLLAVLAQLGDVTVIVVIAVALVVGATNAFSIPASMTIVPSLVEVPDMAAAVTLNSVTYNIARAIGPVGGALVIGTLGIPAAFALNTLSYVVFFVVLLRMSVGQRVTPLAKAPRMQETVQLLRSDTRLAWLLLIGAAVGLTSDPINTLAPAFARTVFGRSDTFGGYLIGAFGAGAVVAAFFVAVAVRRSRARVAVMLALFGATIALFSFAPTALALGLLFAAGVCYLSSLTAATTQLQLGVHDSQRGRVMALWSVSFLGVRPIGSLADGLIASGFGVRAAAVVMAVPAVALAAVLLTVGSRTKRDGVAAMQVGPHPPEPMP
jgi:MFS family permease